MGMKGFCSSQPKLFPLAQRHSPSVSHVSLELFDVSVLFDLCP